MEAAPFRLLLPDSSKPSSSPKLNHQLLTFVVDTSQTCGYIQGMETKTRSLDTTTAITEQVTNYDVIAAVSAGFKQRRPFEQHWAFYMSADDKSVFSGDVKAFVQACRNRERWLTQ